MNHYEELASMGILRNTKVPPDLAWLTDDEKTFLLTLFIAGPDGIHKRRVAKIAPKGDALLRISAACLAHWERDNMGREMYLVLSHKGEEAAQTLLAVAKSLNNHAGATKR